MKLVLIPVIFILFTWIPLNSSDHIIHGQLHKLLMAYPGKLKAIQDNHLIFKDGDRMPVRKYESTRSFQEMLEYPDLYDQISMSYPRMFQMPVHPLKDADPGRIRYIPFFEKLYGSSEEEVKSNLVQITWMPKSSGKTLWVTSVNGVNQKLEKISAEFDNLPDSLQKFVLNPSGTFVYRKISGTNRPSMHSYGIAIDIDSRYADYWKWNRSLTYKNQIPMEIVDVFYRNGFIWGGAWYHYDTMHFEYRPELTMDNSFND